MELPTCTICLEPVDPATESTLDWHIHLPCENNRHVFHAACIQQWAGAEEFECPNCRATHQPDVVENATSIIQDFVIARCAAKRALIAATLKSEPASIMDGLVIDTSISIALVCSDSQPIEFTTHIAVLMIKSCAVKNAAFQPFDQELEASFRRLFDPEQALNLARACPRHEALDHVKDAIRTHLTQAGIATLS